MSPTAAPARGRGGGSARKRGQQETRAALLGAASRLFAEHGLAGTSIDRIAAAAGYTKGAFYANFASKDELLLSMLDQRFTAELERLDRALAGQGPPAEEARGAAEDFVRFAWSDPEWPRVFFEFTAHAARNEAFRVELAARYRSMQERLAAVYGRWSEQLPAEPPLPLEQVARMSFCMANGFLMEQLISADHDEQLYGTMMATFFRGLAAGAIGLDLDAPSEQIERGQAPGGGAG